MTQLKEPRLLSFLPSILRFKNQTGILETPGSGSATRGTPLECQRDSNFAQIPEEILLLIADHLDETAKASLIRTCRYCHRLLEVTLYHRITPVLPWRYDRNDLLFRTLEQRQDLLPYIRTYHGPLMPTILEAPQEPPQKQSLLGRFNNWRRVEPITSVYYTNQARGFKRAVFIFKQTTNIVELHFTDFVPWSSNPLYEPIKKAVSEMSLRKLTLPRCEGIIQILRDQPELQELRLGWNSTELEQLEKTDIPKLKSLASSLQEAALLVPGRPIEQLSLIPCFGPQDFDEELFNKLLLSTTRITAFFIYLQHPRQDEVVRTAFRVIARTLPEVERFTIDVGGRISGRVILDEIPSLQSIRHLTFLDARLTTAADQASSAADDSTQVEDEDDSIPQAPAVEDWGDLFAQLRELCPSLVNVSDTQP